ncbi:MAG: IreB family regulatory phosphoprotein [Firmicutes bacterium]|nr:IreB family regulatory phosphoprotein [Bacillota bacterium]
MERKTIMFDTTKVQQKTTREVLEAVYAALEERGYNGIDQMVGYILSGDPSYITSYNNARMMISRIDRDDLVEEILKDYLQK